MSLLVDIRKNFGDFSLEAFFEVKNREFIGLLERRAVERV